MSDVIKKVKEAWDIVQEIQKVVALNKRGQNYVGLCPFHSEKTPSFYVSPLKKMFHCFGCGENGDVITFVMKHEHLSFKEVIAEKAAEFQIPNDFKPDGAGSSEIDNIRTFLNELQLKYLEWVANEELVKQYIQERHVSDAAAKTFGLGFSPQAKIQQTWLQKSSQLSNANKSGLFKEDGFPLLQERLIFPIHNARGILVGFSGRVLTDTKVAKYINSPESSIFSKKKLLYGMHHAKAAIKKADMAIVVEGYMDVIAMHQHGFENVVAVMGTALTEQHAQELSKYSKNVILMFDSDKAGVDATLKSIEPLQLKTMSVSIAHCNEKDPADVLASGSAESMKTIIGNAKFYMDHFMDRYQDIKQMDANKKSQVVSFLCKLLKKEQNKIVKEDFIKKIADAYDVSPSIVTEYSSNDLAEYRKQPPIQLKADSKFKKAEEAIIYKLISDATFRQQYLETLKDHISIFSSKEIYELFLNNDLIDYELMNKIGHSEIKSFLIQLVIKFTEQNLTFSNTEMEEYIKTLNQAKVTQRITEIKELLNQSQGNQEKELLIELSQLIKKIK
ncbi:MAG: DNA primase [Candidatus Marinamargulisbacteria bacterium]